MKTIGLLGGMSWESTLEYYRALNQGVKQRLGGLHSAKIVMHSVDFAPIEELMRKGKWQQISATLSDGVIGLEKAGADFFLICTNTMHKLAPQLEERVDIPLLHIADAAAEVLIARKIKKVGLLGTAFTMAEDFYSKRLQEKHGLEVIIPNSEDRVKVNEIIFSELCRGRITEHSKSEYLRIIKDLEKDGAGGMLLGCTEIGMLVKQEDVDAPLFDTTPIHAAKAVEMALKK